MLRNQGWSLVELLIASLLCALIMLGVGYILRDHYWTVKIDHSASTLLQLRQHFREHFSCTLTRSNLLSGCADGQIITIIAKDSTPLISNSSPNTQLFGFHLRAKCGPCEICGAGVQKILLEYQTVQGSAADNDWKDLFKGVPIACQVPNI